MPEVAVQSAVDKTEKRCFHKAIPVARERRARQKSVAATLALNAKYC